MGVDEERNFKCNACGKGFARIDVLKKHEAVACKMIRTVPPASSEQTQSKPQPQPSPIEIRQTPQSESRGRGGNDFPIPRASASVVRIAPRESGTSRESTSNRHEGIDKPCLWRKRQRRDSDESEASGSSGEREAEEEYKAGRGYDGRYANPTYSHPQPQAQLQHTPSYPPAHRYPPHHQLGIGSSSTPIHALPHLPPLGTSSTSYSMPLISPTQPRDMSISLAPAYALTPDVSATIPDPERAPQPLKIDTNVHSLGQSMAVDPSSALEPISAGHAHRYEPEQSVGPGGFEMPAKVGENMDDLLGWLFNTNAPGTGGDWGFGVQQGQTQQEMMPTFSAELVAQQSGQGEDLPYPSYYPADAPTGAPGYGQSQNYQVQSHHPWTSHQDGGHSLSSNGAGPSGSQSQSTQRRYPQPYHPLYVPNMPGKTNIPTFNGSGNERASIQGRERYKEVIDDEVKDAMLDMFEVSLDPWSSIYRG
jgi:hypothetical protein